jgi:hypothetical protein
MIGFNKKIPDDLDGSTYRSVYLPVMRDQLPDVLRLFDFAEPSLVTGKRDSTNVPPQSLYLMNSDFIRARAEGLARRVSVGDADQAARIEWAFQYCFNRPPDEVEKELVTEYFKNAVIPASGIDERLINFCQSLLASADFRLAD